MYLKHFLNFTIVQFLPDMNSFTFSNDECVAYEFWAESCHPIFKAGGVDEIYVADTPVKSYSENEGFEN